MYILVRRLHYQLRRKNKRVETSSNEDDVFHMRNEKTLFLH